MSWKANFYQCLQIRHFIIFYGKNKGITKNKKWLEFLQAIYRKDILNIKIASPTGESQKGNYCGGEYRSA